MDRSDLAKRMKGYESVSKTRLVSRMPVIIRIDGKAFHTFTRGFKKPFDEVLIKSIQDTMKYLCENIQGCVLGYHQSDEITLVLVDYKKLNSSSWFDNEVQKICSIAASMATMAFNKFFKSNVEKMISEYNCSLVPQCMEIQMKIDEYHRTLLKAVSKGAMFDARCFNIPKEEVTNNIYWRQLDATRNSIQMVGQANFSQKELNGKSCNKIQDILFTQKGINWNNFPTYQKRGSCCVRNKIVISVNGMMGTAQLRDTSKSENEWIIDKNIPIFKVYCIEYVDKLIYIVE